MHKYTYITMALAPIACMSSWATPEAAATTAIQSALSEMTTLVNQSAQKDVPAIVSELDALLARTTPGILASLEPLTNEQRMAVIGNIMQAPEIGGLMESVGRLQESPAAAAITPIVDGDADPMTFAATQTLQTKVKVVDICANLLKIALGLGIDTPEVQALFGSTEESGGETGCSAE